MRTFKKIKLIPLTDVESLELKASSKKEWDLTSLPEDKQQEAVAHVVKLFHTKFKDKGVIVAGSRSGEAPHVMTQVRSGQNKKKVFSFQEPNPVRLYYRNANVNLEKAYKHRIAFNAIPATNQQEQGEVFAEFFAEVSLGIVALVMTVEGFINQLLSDTSTYSINGQVKTKSEIEWFDFNKKIREVILVISSVDYVNDFKQDYDNLSLTNSLRDDLIHLKRIETANFTNYETLFKRLLDFDPVSASDSVFNFVNTIKQNYFEEQE